MAKTPPKKPKPENIETEADAWQRFEKTIGKIVPGIAIAVETRVTPRPYRDRI